MKIQKRKSRERRGERWWQELVREQALSGCRVSELCRANGVSAQSFYWWRQRSERAGKRSFTELEVGVVNECEIRCKGGRSVVIRGAVCPEVLRSVIAAAEGGGR